ncbi:MAG: PA2778 family cysteine peptidase [Halioglobus sp.]
MTFAVPKGWPAIVLGVLVGCSNLPDGADNPGLGHLSPARSLSNIPFFPQIEDQCGPASLATVLAAQGVDVSAEALRGKVYIPGKEGAVTTEMIARARRYGMLAYVLEPDLSEVLTEIDAGHPVLVMQNLGFAWLPRWHFSVVVGYDLNRQTIDLRSGEKRVHTIDFGLFQKTWQRARSWAMVTLSAGELPATARPQKTLDAAVDLEQVGEAVAALSVYESIIERWPWMTVAYFGAGNSAYELGQYEASQSFFSSYLRQQPSAAAGWNNLAYSLAAMGCGAQALRAIDCAVRTAPADPALRQSQVEISALVQPSSKPLDCPQPECPFE